MSTPEGHAGPGTGESGSGAGTQAFNAAGFDAVLFDLDGVLTSTAKIHARCWKETFDSFLKARSERSGQPFRPFELDIDYKTYVDGKSRYDGVRSFLDSRGISLPQGSPDSPPQEQSVCGLGNRKDQLVEQAIRAGQARSYPGAVAFVRWLREQGLRTAVVSSSHHCANVLRATGIEDLFDTRVDGRTVDELQLPGKPAPDIYLHAARLLGVLPSRAAVVEDADAGVEAGRAGGFALVVGVDRGGAAQLLRQHGADRVVSDPGELIPKGAAEQDP